MPTPIRIVAAMFGLFLVLPAAATAAIETGPRDFKVDLDATPDVTVDISEFGPQNLPLVQELCELPSIPPPLDTPFPCTIPVDVQDAGNSVTGSIREVAGKLGGDFDLNCDFTAQDVVTGVLVSLSTGFVAKPEDVILTSMDGGGPIGCNWAADFGKNTGTLTGTALGNMDLAKADSPQTIAVSVDLDVKIVTGTGFSSAAVGGKGDYVDVYAAPFTPESLETRLADVDPADDGTFAVNVKKAKSLKAAIVPLPTAITDLDTRRVRAVAPRGYACKATAKRSGTTVELGKKEVKGRDGEITFKPVLADVLTTKGEWKIKASCKKGKKRLDDATATVERG